MEKEKRDRCVKIMAEIFKQPLNEFFKNKIVERDEELDKYKSIIPNPIRLIDVLEKLAKCQYDSQPSWYNEVIMVYKNAMKYYEEGKPIHQMALYQLAIFKKIAAPNMLRPQEWYESVNRMTHKLHRIIDHNPIPQGIDPFVLGVVNYASCMIPISPNLIFWTLRAIDELSKDKKHMYDIICILKQTRCEVDFSNPEIKIEFENLPKITLNALFLYASTLQQELLQKEDNLEIPKSLQEIRKKLTIIDQLSYKPLKIPSKEIGLALPIVLQLSQEEKSAPKPTRKRRTLPKNSLEEPKEAIEELTAAQIIAKRSISSATQQIDNQSEPKIKNEEQKNNQKEQEIFNNKEQEIFNNKEQINNNNGKPIINQDEDLINIEEEGKNRIIPEDYILQLTSERLNNANKSNTVNSDARSALGKGAQNNCNEQVGTLKKENTNQSPKLPHGSPEHIELNPRPNSVLAEFDGIPSLLSQDYSSNIDDVFNQSPVRPISHIVRIRRDRIDDSFN